LNTLPACYKTTLATNSLAQGAQTNINVIFTCKQLRYTTTVLTANKRSMCLEKAIANIIFVAAKICKKKCNLREETKYKHHPRPTKIHIFFVI